MPAQQQPDKRVRLIDAAMKLSHEQGFAATTLADVANAADVPLGNVYYYFRTKEAIGEALVQRRLDDSRAIRDRWGEEADPRDRLQAFVQMTVGNRRHLARSGCPIGSLCSELNKGRGPLAEHSNRLFAELLSWLEDQFRALGQGTESRGLAVHLLSVLQGASVLTHSFGTPKYVEGEARRMTEWIRSL